MLPYRDSNGNVVGMIAGWVDVSERQRLLGQLQEAKEEADAANSAKFLDDNPDIKDALEKQLREKLLGPKTDAELAEMKVMPKLSKAAKEAAALAEAEEMENATDSDN